MFRMATNDETRKYAQIHTEKEQRSSNKIDNKTTRNDNKLNVLRSIAAAIEVQFEHTPLHALLHQLLC
jgi:hypothetical protein